MNRVENGVTGNLGRYWVVLAVCRVHPDPQTRVWTFQPWAAGLIGTSGLGFKVQGLGFRV